jgi:hypothetical protein
MTVLLIIRMDHSPSSIQRQLHHAILNSNYNVWTLFKGSNSELQLVYASVFSREFNVSIYTVVHECHLHGHALLKTRDTCITVSLDSTVPTCIWVTSISTVLSIKNTIVTSTITVMNHNFSRVQARGCFSSMYQPPCYIIGRKNMTLEQIILQSTIMTTV